MRKNIFTLLIIILSAITLQAQENAPMAKEVIQENTFEDLYRYGNFYISGQPEVARLTWLKDHGVKKIINLRSEEEIREFKEETYDEQFVAEQLGFDFYSLPVDSKTGFTHVNQAAFNALADAGTPTLVHCQSGKRATFFFIAYLVQERGYTLEEAVSIGRQMKYSSPLEQLLDEEFILEIAPD